VTQITLPEWPWQAVSRLAHTRGTRVWPVGGAVRDALLDRPIHDWDFAVARDALGLARAVADALDGAYFPLDTERGAGRVILTAGNTSRLVLDFAILRGKGLEEDLLARDFTVNALALDETGEVIDPTGGEADLAARMVRATHPGVFSDDPVRLLRAVRIGAELGFEIEPQTAARASQEAGRLVETSPERVRDELVRLLTLPGASVPLQRLDELGLLIEVIPELEDLKGVRQSPPHRHDVWQHTLETMDALEGVVAAVAGRDGAWPADVPPAAREETGKALGRFSAAVADHLAVEVSSGRDRAGLLKLAALLHDVGKPKTGSEDDDGRIHFYNHDLVGAQVAASRLEALRFSRDEVARMRTIVGQHLRPAHLARSDAVTRRAVYRFFRATSCGGVDVILLALADHLATWGPALQEARWARRLEVAGILLGHWFEQYHQTVAPPVLITGRDLIDEMGLSPGPRVGRLLEAVREAQAAGEVTTRKQALALAKKLGG